MNDSYPKNPGPRTRDKGPGPKSRHKANSDGPQEVRFRPSLILYVRPNLRSGNSISRKHHEVPIKVRTLKFPEFSLSFV